MAPSNGTVAGRPTTGSYTVGLDYSPYSFTKRAWSLMSEDVPTPRRPSPRLLLPPVVLVGVPGYLVDIYDLVLLRIVRAPSLRAITGAVCLVIVAAALYKLHETYGIDLD
jgi:hypothetical protein